MYNWINNIFGIKPKLKEEEEEKELTIANIIEKYREVVSFDENKGEVLINDKPYNKDIWYPKD